MLDEPLSASLDRELTTNIVAAYVRRNQIGSDQLGTLISTFHQALVGLGKPAAETDVERTPAVAIRQSVHRDYVVCLDCGWRGQMLKRHLATGHGLNVEQYRARWNLRREHPMTAPQSPRLKIIMRAAIFQKARYATLEHCVSALTVKQRDWSWRAAGSSSRAFPPGVANLF
jgi:predicted transcriptional regulator